MSIRVNWINNNINFTNIKIYRSTEVIEGKSLGTPITTLTTGTTYLDTTSKPDTVYWYALEITNAGESVISYLSPTIQVSVNGPGPVELLRGDAVCGYYGQVPAEEMLANSELQAAINVGGIISQVTKWDKFIFNGKILYLPRTPCISGVSWVTLYNAGLIYGVDGPGLPKGLTPVNQLVQVSKGNFDFKVRTLRAGTDPDYAFMEPGTNDFKSEFRRLQGALYYGGGYPSQGVYNLNSLNVSEYTTGVSGVSATGILAEANTSYSVITSTNPYAVSNAGRASPYAWRPVLELIQPPRG